MNGKVRQAAPVRRKGSRVRKGRAPTTVNGKVPPRRLPNAERRPREYLAPEEAERYHALGALAHSREASLSGDRIVSFR
jgi:hypothetical protein